MSDTHSASMPVTSVSAFFVMVRSDVKEKNARFIFQPVTSLLSLMSVLKVRPNFC